MSYIYDDDDDSLFIIDGSDGHLDFHLASSQSRSLHHHLQTTLSQPGGSSAGARPSLRSTHQTRRTEPTQNTPQPGQQSESLNNTPTFIDLTEEPDSPEQPRRNTGTQTQGARNPRRTNSQRTSPPSLARSDGTFVNRPNDSFIDLTADSPEEDRPADNLRSREAHHHHHHHHHHHPPARPRPDDLIELEFISSAPRPVAAVPGRERPGFAFGVARTLAGFFGREFITFTTPQLDVTRNAFAPPRTSPKPVMEPIPPAREGFTRATRASPEKEEETIAICPSCSEELAYDPSEPATKTPFGGKKRKRAPGEHHFWALKKCGHVYCADCFENRKKASACRGDGGFRQGPTSTSPSDFRCAVDSCETKVSSKAEWVGIYL